MQEDFIHTCEKRDAQYKVKTSGEDLSTYKNYMATRWHCIKSFYLVLPLLILYNRVLYKININKHM